MRRSLLTLALLLAAALVLLWGLGGLDGLARLAQDSQRAAQNAMAGALRALRANEAGALAMLIGLAFGYGVAHAAGPGHGKVAIGAYGAATEVRLAPLAGIALAAGLAQATTAVLLVHGGIALFDWTRAEMTELGEGALARASTAAIGLIGLWLVVRGARRLLRPPTNHHHDHHHAHAHAHETCDACGHRHGPSAAEVARLTGWRDAALLVGAIAIRPCTGALFLLILTWRMDMTAAGILGTYAMGVGTALVTAGFAALAVSARDGALMWSGRVAALRPLGPVLELGAGLLIAVFALQALRLGL
jgi:ABC-type nickel/cobalt efflux system permease component RcnA